MHPDIPSPDSQASCGLTDKGPDALNVGPFILIKLPIGLQFFG